MFVGLKVSDVNLFMIGNYQAKKRDDVIVDFKIYNLYNFQSVFFVYRFVLYVFFYVFLSSRLLLLFVNTVDSEQRSGKCRQFAKAYQYRLMHLPFRRDEYAAEQHNQPSYRQHRRSD